MTDRPFAHRPAIRLRSGEAPSMADLHLGRKLRVLTGVAERLLDNVPHERSRFTGLAGVVLGTAAIATFSMSIALSEVLGGFSVVLLLPALIWGLFVLNLDRWLVASATGTQWGKRLALLLPRLALAMVFGVIVAEPLVLLIFQTAIEQRIDQNRQNELGALRTAMVACNPVPGRNDHPMNPAGLDCHNYRLNVAVDPAGDAAQLAADRDQATSLQSTVNGETTQLAALNDAATKECGGATGPGLTGKIGYGRQCTDRWAAANQFASTHPIAQQQTQLTKLQGAITTLSAKVDGDQAAYQRAVADATNERVSERRGQMGAIGMLERFQALHELTSTDASVFAARWTVSIFLILVDCLPVLGKLIGGISSYDRLVDSASTSAVRVFEADTQQREDDLLAAAETRRHESRSRARKLRDEADFDVLAHRNDLERRMDEQTDLLTARLLRKHGPQPADLDEVESPI